MEEKKMQVEMTSDEAAQFAAFKEQMQREAEERKRKEDRQVYASMVDDEIAAAIPELRRLSADIREVKRKVYNNFSDVLRLKADVLRLTKDNQRTHTFTHSNGTERLTLGCYCVDSYRDTVEDGISMVRQYIESLATDDKTKALVNAIMRLLSRDAMGNLKASRVLQLRKMAEDSGDPRFKEGVQIIEESYMPQMTRQFIRAEYKDKKGVWHTIPLSVTDADEDDDAESTVEESATEASSEG